LFEIVFFSLKETKGSWFHPKWPDNKR